VVRPNVAQPVRLDPESTIDSTLTALSRLAPSGSRKVAPELVVWPEATILASIEADGELQRRVVEIAERWRAPVLFGAMGQGSAGAHVAVPFNSAFLTDENGMLTDFRYDKHRLVPLVERVPFVPVAWVASAGRCLASTVGAASGRSGRPEAETDSGRSSASSLPLLHTCYGAGSREPIF